MEPGQDGAEYGDVAEEVDLEVGFPCFEGEGRGGDLACGLEDAGVEDEGVDVPGVGALGGCERGLEGGCVGAAGTVRVWRYT